MDGDITSPLPPQVLLLEDDPLDAKLARLLLEHAGFDVIWVASVAEGATSARRLLDPAQHPASPLLLLFDLRMPIPSNPALEASVLVATLAQDIRTHQLRPAWIVAYTNYLDARHEDAARYAGCHHVLPKPLTNRATSWLRELVMQPPALPPLEGQDRGWAFYHAQATQLLHMTQSAQPSAGWSPEEVHVLLCTITAYPAPKVLDRGLQERILLTVGGADDARELLTRCAEHMDAQDPARHMLLAFLRGHQKHELFHLLPYEHRSTIYRLIKALPQKICAYLGAPRRAGR